MLVVVLAVSDNSGNVKNILVTFFTFALYIKCKLNYL